MSIKVSGLTKLYGAQKAVDEISFEVNKGEVLGFLGPNGAGKSTTMKILTCFIPQTSGTATVCGYDTSAAPLEVTKHIGYLPENNPLYYDMYVREYLEFVAGLHKLGKITNQRIDEMIEVTGLTAERKKKVGQLSKGYKQRVGIAQAMLHNPEVLILDEPTSGLDPNQLVEIRSLIKQLGKDKTVIFSSHIMQEVQAVADRVIIINKGKIVANDSTESLQSKISNEIIVTAEFKQTVDRGLLGMIKGVKSYEQLKDGKWNFRAEGQKDLREDIFNFAKEKNLTLLHLNKEEYSLEDVFKQLTK
ncbi:MAG TPA: gliding motility-associated ABC transporter ATP-binding subunit GldA [Chitinophagales bacterium]|nr:gliding motility-associated ABC transporter ATP-binding subunit GldA [Chitinophagales bacterium]